MPDQKRVQAVYKYLLSEFPDSTVEDSYDGDRGAYLFRIDHKGTGYSSVVFDEFLESHSASDIKSVLKTFLFAEHIRDMVDTGVGVTKAGLVIP